MDGGAWRAAVHGIAKSRTQLNDFIFTFHCHALEKEMATHSSVLGWRIPGTEEPGRLPSLGSHRVGHNWSDLAAAAEAKRKLNIRQYVNLTLKDNSQGKETTHTRSYETEAIMKTEQSQRGRGNEVWRADMQNKNKKGTWPSRIWLKGSTTERKNNDWKCPSGF